MAILAFWYFDWVKEGLLCRSRKGFFLLSQEIVPIVLGCLAEYILNNMLSMSQNTETKASKKGGKV